MFTFTDPKQVLKPVGRMGGITFSRTTEGFELPRPEYDEVVKDPEVAKLADSVAHQKL